MRKLLILSLFILTSCVSAQVPTKNDYLFQVGFMGSDLEHQTIKLFINDTLLFEYVKFKDIPYNLHMFDIAIGYNGNAIELFSLRKGGVLLKSQDLIIKDLKKMKFEIEVKGRRYEQFIDISDGKVQYIKLKNKQIDLIQSSHW